MNFKNFINRILLLGVVFFLYENTIFAQKLARPQVSFTKDSVKLGQEVDFSISFLHKSNLEILFPDSSYDFYPFEYVSKKYFTTRSDSSNSLDSVVYTLCTFELEPTLSLSLPIFIFENGDTSRLYSEPSEIILDEIVRSIAPNDSLKTNTQLIALNTKINYPYLIIGLGSVVFLALVIFVFFRKRIIAQIKLYRMKLDFDKFNKVYVSYQNNYSSKPSVAILQDMLSLWKKYLEKLLKTPYTTLTTKEIAAMLDILQLTSSLQNFDRAIYGGFVKEDLSNSIICLKEIAELKYIKTQKVVKNV